MYQFRKATLNKGESCKYVIYRQEEQLSYTDFITLLEQEKPFRSFFINLLSGISFRSYQWETPPVSANSADRPFEFVIHNSPAIDLPPDPDPFRSYFNKNRYHSESGITVFDNLGSDAILIAPAPLKENLNYSHIGVFTGEAPLEQQHILWQVVGRVTESEISDQPLWLNTAGGGVAWLHVRLDSRPKYCRHRPYINA